MQVPNDPRLFDGLPLTLFRVREEMIERLHLGDLSDIGPDCVAAKLSDGCQAHETVNKHKVLIFGNDQYRGDLIETLDRGCDYLHVLWPGDTSMGVAQVQSIHIHFYRCARFLFHDALGIMERVLKAIESYLCNQCQ